MRGHNIWLSCVPQELNQIDEQLRNTLLSLGTYIIGGTASMDSARLLADALFFRDPYWVKHYRPVYGRTLPYKPMEVIAEEPEFMPLNEQRELFAQRVKKLGLFQFLLRPALSEGSIGLSVLPLSIRNIDRTRSPDSGLSGPTGSGTDSRHTGSQIRQTHGSAAFGAGSTPAAGSTPRRAK